MPNSVQSISSRGVENACPTFISDPPGSNPFNPSNLKCLSAVEAIEFLHRGEGSVVIFHRKYEEQWQELGGIPISNLRDTLPSIAEYLVSDSYFSINSFYPRTYLKNVSAITGLPLYSRRADQLRWVNAVFIDFDLGHYGEHFSFESWSDSFLSQLARNELPRPSLLVSSGRGGWSLWRLADHSDRGRPVRAFPEKLEIYRRVNRALMHLFRELGADANSTDPSRVMRLPQTSNTKAPVDRCLVQFYKVSDELCTLPELANVLRVKTHKVKLPGEYARSKDEARVRAGVERWKKPLEGFASLWRMRGHFLRGERHCAVYVYSLLLRRNRASDDEILMACRQLAASCRPRLDEADIRRCLSSSRRAAYGDFENSISNEAIARMLGITPEERAALSGWFRPRSTKRVDRISRRLSIIRQILEGSGVFDSDRSRWIPAREMARTLSDMHDVTISHATILKDYRALLCARDSEESDRRTGKFRGS